jgi:hypothetical protein
MKPTGFSQSCGKLLSHIRTVQCAALTDTMTRVNNWTNTVQNIIENGKVVRNRRGPKQRFFARARSLASLSDLFLYANLVMSNAGILIPRPLGLLGCSVAQLEGAAWLS